MSSTKDKPQLVSDSNLLASVQKKNKRTEKLLAKKQNFDAKIRSQVIQISRLPVKQTKKLLSENLKTNGNQSSAILKRISSIKDTDYGVQSGDFRTTRRARMIVERARSKRPSSSLQRDQSQ